MPQIFPRSFNTLSKASLALAVLVVATIGWSGPALHRSPWVTQEGVVRDQPVPFSHAHHVGEIGIDCRYCHHTVEDGPFAGMPSTKTCMGCHSHIWADSPMLAPVRESLTTGKPLRWTRVHDLADYVYFDHGVHVRKGVACTSCHGDVASMPLMHKTETMYMKWCLDCHRDPHENVVAPESVFAPLTAQRPANGEVDLEPALDCADCHR